MDNSARSGVNEGLESESLKEHAIEFVKVAAEMTVEFGKGFRDIVKQTVVNEDSYIVRKFGGHFDKVCGRLRFLNEYLMEDRDPVHCWLVIFFVFLLAFAGMMHLLQKMHLNLQQRRRSASPAKDATANGLPQTSEKEAPTVVEDQPAADTEPTATA